MLHFRTTQWQRSKLPLNNNINDTSGRVLVFRPTSFEELPVEIVQRILSHMDFGDRQSFRATSTHFRLVHDRLVEHRVKKMFRSSFPSSSSSSSPPLFLEHFCRLIHESTVFLHRVAFPQFLGMFVCQGDLLSIRSLHSSVVGKFSHAQSIGDMSDVFEKLLLQYLCVVQSGCGSHRSRFKWLLILTLVHVLKVCGDLSTYVHSTLTLPLSLSPVQNCRCATLKKRHRSQLYLQLDYGLQGGWMGSLWPSNERKSLSLPILVAILLEMDISMRMNQSFR